MKGYLMSADKFLHSLVPLIHMAYGSPARAEEFIKMKIVNDAYGHRNIFWHYDRLLTILSYQKGSNLRGSDKVSLR